ncbi:hypothetical protein Cgig2_010138 [Carnegiea gigantea]|uniref:Protein FAR1-RELATED SEQUENCE n=1 Tax=Carnegiea gigantea TaxID=171969 RepID=A0A9Q1KH37_9CARY|nr:hypothetical protein Cgig2_010138 [Carnegiea gigantea]
MVKITNVPRVIVMHTCCVQKVPDRYIMKKWSKGIKEIQSNELIVEGGMKDTAVCSSVWRMQMGRKMNALLTASQMNKEARLLCEEYFSKLQELIEVEVGSVYVEGDVQQDGSSSAKIVIPENVTGVQESSKMTNVEVQRSTKGVPQNIDAVLNGVPLCMNVPSGGSSSQGNVVPTLNLLSNSNPNDPSLRQSTIAAVGYYLPFYFDPRTAGGLTPMICQSFIGQTPINGVCNQSCNNDV